MLTDMSLRFQKCDTIASTTVIHPFKFLILEEEDDGRGGGGRMAAAVYPAVQNLKRRKQVINK